MADKYYRIGDAATLLGLKTYVLRFWETEFPELRPVRTGKGQRRYTEADVARLRQIRYLLHEQGLTIEGARRVLSGESALSLDDAASGALPQTAQSGVQGAPVAGSGTVASVSGSSVPAPRTTGPVQLVLLPLPSLSPVHASGISPASPVGSDSSASPILPVSNESPSPVPSLPSQPSATSPAGSADAYTNASTNASTNAAIVRVAAELRALQALVRGL